MSQPLRIRLLGAFDVSTEPPFPTRLYTPRLQSLLAYLLLHRDVPQLRAHLAFLLWPDSSESQARTNLRNLLHQLRHSAPYLDRYLLIDSATVCWHSCEEVSLDVAEFEQALDAAESARRTGESDGVRAALQRAVGLYRNDLLPSCYDDWVLPIRERLRQLFLSTLEELIALAEERRDYQDGIRSAKRLLEHEPLYETSHLTLMRLQALSGDRAAALHTYQSCATLLERELGAEPDRALRELYLRLTRTEGLSAPRTASGAEKLVGRRAEWSAMLDVWDAVAAGRARLLILSGEAGVGKTRLAEELLHWAELQGYATARARCYAAEGELPYGPIVSWLRAPVLTRKLAQLEPVWAAEVSRLAPEIRAQRADLPQLEPVDEPCARQRLFEALARATDTGGQMLVLLLDDAQWCDRSTLAWLHYRLRRGPADRLLVVATLRREDLDGDGVVAASLQALAALDRVSEIALRPLDEAETAQLAAEVAGAPLTTDEAARLYRETEGNPLFVVKLAQPADRTRQAEAWLTERPGPHLPPGIVGVISARLAGLSPQARQLAELAATIGREFNWATLAHAAHDVDEDTMVQALDELWRRRIVREHAVELYDFSHNKLREVLYQQLSGARRRLLHRRVAAAYEALAPVDQPLRCAQTAAHYEQAGWSGKAVELYRRAAEAARQVYANAEVQAYLERAIALLNLAHPAELAGVDVPALALELQERLGEVLALTGRYPEAEATYQQALRRASPADAVACARLHSRLDDVLREQHRYGEAEQAYQHGQALLAAAPPHADQGWWQGWLDLQLAHCESLAAQTSASTAATLAGLRERLERFGSPEQRARYHELALITFYRDSGGEAAEAEYAPHVRALLAASDESAARTVMATARGAAGIIFLLFDRLDRAEELFQEMLALARATGYTLAEARALICLATVARRRRRHDLTREYGEQALALARAAQLPDCEASALACLAAVSRREQRHAEAEAQARAALEFWQRVPVFFLFRWAALWPLLAAAVERDDLDEAAAHARALIEPGQQRPPAALEAALARAADEIAAGAAATAQNDLRSALAMAQELGFL
jgi:DNA-binding SARP family transcriptional activator/tetratricopeptide (TPR) repeat protein